MRVNSINILSAHFDRTKQIHCGTVGLLVGKSNVTLDCIANLPENSSVTDVISRFLADAKRQLLRMPEYRSGTQILEFSQAPDAHAYRSAA